MTAPAFFLHEISQMQFQCNNILSAIYFNISDCLCFLLSYLCLISKPKGGKHVLLTLYVKNTEESGLFLIN